MLGRLNEALAECVAEREVIANRDDELAIAEMVAKYEAEVRESYAGKKQAELVEKDYEIKALKNLIVKEEVRIANETAVVEAVAETEFDTVSEEVAIADNAFQG